MWRANVCCSVSPAVGGGRFALTPGGGAGMSWQQGCSRTIWPRRVFDVVPLCEPAAMMLPWVRTPARVELASNMTFAQPSVEVAGGFGRPYSLARFAFTNV